MATGESFYQTVLENISDGVYVCDRDQRVSYWSPGAERITGFPAEQVQGASCTDKILMHVDLTGASLYEKGSPLAATLADGKKREARVYLHHKEGHRVPLVVRTSPIYDAAGTIDAAVEVFSDNSTLLVALKRVEDLSVEMETDPLTGALNRRSMEARLDSYLTERRRMEASVGVLFVDIDHFKNVNDTFGHEVGDEVLKMVAETLRDHLRASDSLARWGGEEFLVLLHHVDAKGCVTVAEKLRRLVADSSLSTDDSNALSVTVSLGGTLLRPGDNRHSLITRVDHLLYESKAKGRNLLTWAD